MLPRERKKEKEKNLRGNQMLVVRIYKLRPWFSAVPVEK